MKNKLLLSLGCVMLLVPLALLLKPSREHRRLYASERRQWKEQSLARLAATVPDAQMISNEVARLRVRSPDHSADDWIGANVLLMNNGEFLVYADINAKQDGRIHDLFLARASDGKWYFSTYHFCSGMVSIRVDDQPGSIAEFSARYFLQPFDGKLDECLKKTWPVRK